MTNVSKEIYTAPKIKAHIISVIDKVAISRNYKSIGALSEYYTEADRNTLKFGKDTKE